MLLKFLPDIFLGIDVVGIITFAEVARSPNYSKLFKVCMSSRKLSIYTSMPLLFSFRKNDQEVSTDLFVYYVCCSDVAY